MKNHYLFAVPLLLITSSVTQLRNDSGLKCSRGSFQTSSEVGNAATDCFELRYAQLTNTTIDSTLAFAKQKLTTAAKRLNPAQGYPRVGLNDGNWQTVRASDWTSGFFGGSLWYLYQWQPDKSVRGLAEKWTIGLEDQKDRAPKIGHDLGFMLHNIFGTGYRLTGNEGYKKVVLQASKSLASLFNPKVGCTESWPWAKRWNFPVIMDNMMNLEMLFWAASNGGNPAWKNIAVSHALKTMENHVRPDGSTYHLVDYDGSTGKVIKRVTFQGYSNESTWARGQAWAIYGFTVAYRETGYDQFLQTARKVTKYFIRNLPADYVPYWDFRVPITAKTPRDASAAAIAASGLLELSMLVPDQQEKQKYQQVAKNILLTLSSPKYLTKGTNKSAVLMHSVGGLPQGKEIDVSLVYADYYFIEALLRYRQWANQGMYNISLSH